MATVAGFIAFSGAAQAQSAGDTPGAALRRQMIELAANPNSVVELIDTGRAALRAGDGEAALGFFTRAGELAPRDARVKAGLAAANARMGRPETALTLFNEAVSLGAPVGEIAGERGLAYDLLGQTARAQQDYVLALRHREDPEVRRRMALSLAISGQRDPALRLLDPQVRQGDRAGARARVMVLALSGDVRGATAAANATLPPQAAQAIAPFFSRFASLSPAQMASAANLGRVPSSGLSRMAGSIATAAADPGALAFAGGGSTTSPALRSRLPVTATQSVAPRRRPGTVETVARTNPVPAVQNTRILASSTPPAAAQASRPASSGALTAASSSMVSLPATFLQPHPHQPLRLAGLSTSGGSTGGPSEQESAPEPVELAASNSAQPRVPAASLAMPMAEPVLTAPAPAQATVAIAEAPAQVQPAPTQPQVQPAAEASAQPSAQAAPIEPRPAFAEIQPAQLQGAAANLAMWNADAAAAPSGGAAGLAVQRPAFSEVVAAVSALPTETTSTTAAPAEQRSTAPAPRSAAPAAHRTASAAATRTAARRTASAPARTPQQAHPSRIWVQLGVSQTRSAFNYDMTRMRRAAPQLFQGKTPHVAPIGNSNRLLVGPFADDAAARSFVNGLKQKDISALAWTSPAGTPVERLPAGR